MRIIRGTNDVKLRTVLRHEVVEPTKAAVVIALIDVNDRLNIRIDVLHGLMPFVDQLRKLLRIVYVTLWPEHSARNFVANLHPLWRNARLLEQIERVLGVRIHGILECGERNIGPGRWLGLVRGVGPSV